MGFFRRNKKEKKEPEPYVVSEERIQEILSNGVDVEVAVGTHGADEIVAGAMMGETGKLIAMGNYGKLIYKPTVLRFMDDFILFQFNGQQFSYEDIYRWEKRKVGFIHTEFVFLSYSAGEIQLKATHPDFLAIIEVLPRAVEAYVDRVNREFDEAEKAKHESNMDRLIGLGELHERGLLSDDEFADAKAKLLSGDEVSDDELLGDGEVSGMVFCPSCGNEVSEGNFCMNCGGKL